MWRIIHQTVQRVAAHLGKEHFEFDFGISEGKAAGKHTPRGIASHRVRDMTMSLRLNARLGWLSNVSAILGTVQSYNDMQHLICFTIQPVY